MTSRKRVSNRAIGYVRVSTADQAENGYSLDQQKGAIRKWCNDHGLELVTIYADEGVSGKKSDRPAFTRMIADVLADGISHVICTKVDRFARSANDLFSTSTTLEQAGVDLVFCEQGLDTSTAIGRAMRGMLAVFAELESNMLSERTKAGLAEAKTRGVVPGPKSTLPDEVRQRIHKMHRDGMSYNGIATQLNTEGVPTAAGGKAWYASQVRFIITGQRYGK